VKINITVLLLLCIAALKISLQSGNTCAFLSDRYVSFSLPYYSFTELRALFGETITAVTFQPCATVAIYIVFVHKHTS
jgi:hypothetical protein